MVGVYIRWMKIYIIIYNKYKLYNVIYAYYIDVMIHNNDLFPADTDNR